MEGRLGGGGSGCWVGAPPPCWPPKDPPPPCWLPCRPPEAPPRTAKGSLGQQTPGTNRDLKQMEPRSWTRSARRRGQSWAEVTQENRGEEVVKTHGHEFCLGLV